MGRVVAGLTGLVGFGLIHALDADQIIEDCVDVLGGVTSETRGQLACRLRPAAGWRITSAAVRQSLSRPPAAALSD